MHYAFMNELFAHTRSYPHLHPHGTIAGFVDVFVTIGFWGVLLTTLWFGSRFILRKSKRRSTSVENEGD